MRSTRPVGLSDGDASAIAREVYLYAYPLVLMDVTRCQLTSAGATRLLGAAPPNRFAHARGLAGPAVRALVRPDVDALASSAWLDLAEEPVVLSLPATERSFVLTMSSMWSEVFRVLGTRPPGRDTARSFAVVGPRFHDELPEGLGTIRAPTRWVWLLGRTPTSGAKDYANVHAIQDTLSVRPLHAFGSPSEPSRSGAESLDAVLEPSPPEQVERMSAAQFFARFAELTRDNPPSTSDAAIVARMARLGLRPGEPFVLARAPAASQAALPGALRSGLRAIEEGVRRLVGGGRGWELVPPGGFDERDPLTRAVVARSGLGRSPDVACWVLGVDHQGRPLVGASRYVLRFASGEEPPGASWSVTAYDADGFLVPNVLDRYALGDRDAMVRGTDGSLTIELSADAPAVERANGLPTPRGPFHLVLRVYDPTDAVRSGAWTGPSAIRSV